MHGYVKQIEYYLPANTLTTQDLSILFPEWAVEAIDSKTGIQVRHIAAEDECASDLAVAAAAKLFSSGDCRPDQIDFLIICTQSPDFTVPTTACLVQQRLGIPTKAGAFDFNLGCSGFVYGLGLAEGLITSRQAKSILLITAETYTKYLGKTDKSTRTIFGDGAAATIIEAQNSITASFGPFVYGTDGRGAGNLIVPHSGSRLVPSQPELLLSPAPKVLHMNGNEIFQFAVRTVPRSVIDLLEKADLKLENVDLFIFHQANAYVLEAIRTELGIPRAKMQVTLRHCGNTVSSTIPIALKHADLEGRLTDGSLIMLVGFGVGYSWSATLLRWVQKRI